MSIARPATPLSGQTRIPSGVRLGGATIAFGLLFDLAEHSFAAATPVTGSAADMTLGQHAAHLIVLIGMVIILAAIVRDGIRTSGRTRPEGSARHAIR
jgi:hypothetical protein